VFLSEELSKGKASRNCFWLSEENWGFQHSVHHTAKLQKKWESLEKSGCK